MVAIFFSGCAVNYQSGEIEPQLDKLTAFYSPAGPIYFNEFHKDSGRKAHEECHEQRADQLGWKKFYREYFTSQILACREELRCGIKDHQICIMSPETYNALSEVALKALDEFEEFERRLNTQ